VPRDTPDERFLLGNQSGAFFTNGYSGMGFCIADQGRLVNILHPIEGDRATHHLTSVDVGKVNWLLPMGHDALIMTSPPSKRSWLFDIRRFGDMRQWGRAYEVKEQGKRLIIRFSKKTDHREDQTDGEEEFSMACGISAPAGTIVKTGEWVQAGERHVFEACTTEGTKVIVAASSSEARLVKLLSSLERNEGSLRQHHNQYRDRVVRASSRIMGYVAHGLDSLLSPLSEDSWLRFPYRSDTFDLLTAVPALTYEKEYEHAIDIISKKHKASPEIALWHVFRTNQLLKMLASRHMLSKYLKPSRIQKLTINAINLANSIEADNPITVSGNSDVVIQALALSMYDFLHIITDNEKWRKLELLAAHQAKKDFFRGGMLRDFKGSDDYGFRSYLTAYIYPRMLSHHEWTDHFTRLLDQSWRKGGRACEENWINNIAGTVLTNLHRSFFRPFVEGIHGLGMSEITTGCMGYFQKEGFIDGRATATFIELSHHLGAVRFTE